jgi:zinc transport system permease protein
MQSVGVLLVGALMVIPVITATQIARSFKQIMMYAVAFSVFAVMVGLILSYYFDLAAGGAIVLLALGVFIVVSLLKSK